MTEASGVDPKPPSYPSASPAPAGIGGRHGGAGVDLAVASVAFAASAVMLSLSAVIRMRLPDASGWVGSLLLTIIVNAPLAVAVAVVWRRRVTVRSGRSWQATDLLLGASLGLLLRAVVELVVPTTGSLLGPLSAGDAAPQVAALVAVASGIILVSPIVEELFFRALVLRALVRTFGTAEATTGRVAAVLVSTAAFVALHAVASGGAMSSAALLSSVIVGIGCGIVAVSTSRIGAAIVAHVVFNALGVALLLV